MQDWNDLQFFLAVAEHGSTLAASTVCKTSQSTVFRRIGILEQALGVSLFERRTSGYTLTQAGAALLPLAQRVETAVQLFEQSAARESRMRTMVIRFSAPDVTIEYLLPTIMGAFRKRYPDVRVELIASDRKLNLASGEADVALRTNPDVTETDIFGRRVAYERPMLTASMAYADHHALPEDDAQVAEHNFISLASNLSQLLGGWFEQTVPKEKVLLQPDSLASTLSAVRSGLGISVLPQFLCDRDASLVTAPLKLPVPQFELWIVSHSRLKGSPAVRSFMDLIAQYVLSTTRLSAELPAERLT